MRKALAGLVGMSMMFIGTCVNEQALSPGKLLPHCAYGDTANAIGWCTEPLWIVDDCEERE